MKRVVWVVLTLTLLCCLLITLDWTSPLLAQTGEATDPPATDSDVAAAKLSPAVQAGLQAAADNTLDVIVTLKPRANLAAIVERKRAARLGQVVRALRQTAQASQNRVKALLRTRQVQGKVLAYEPFWIINGLRVVATPEVIQELAAMPEVASITLNATLQAPQISQSANPPEPNLVLVKATALWDLGVRGQNAVVANLDTGVYLEHSDLMARWRGGANSWFDPYNQHPNSPADMSGHGTWTMGVMVGGDAGGTAVGVAPDAQWIAVKIFNDQGSATVSAIHAGFQWLLDPDGNPDTPDAPHAVNNSWTFQNPGCDLTFQADLQALRAAGILPVFAAGNAGPNPGTSYSPANNPEAFAVGAVDNSDQIYFYSSRGPSACGEPTAVYPELVAPGVNIRSTDLYGFYFNATGTSMAAPHVAGALALLLGAFPDLTVAEQEAALRAGAVDLGDTGADNAFGYGRLDILAAYQWVQNNVANQPPAVNAGPDQAITLPASATLEGVVTDDGLPNPPAAVTSNWSQLSGPGTVTFADPASPASTATFSEPGTYELRLTADDGALTASDEVTVTVEPAPPTTILYFSLLQNGNVGALTGVRDEDIVAFDGTAFTLYFDGSAVGVTGDIDAFHIRSSGTILMSFDNALSVPGIAGTVDDSDLVEFDPATGTFTLFFQGADVGLTTNGEDIDAISELADGRLIVSVNGSATVPGVSVKINDEDMLIFTPTSLGANTSGTWAFYFDGSDVGLTGDINGAAVAEGGDIYLSMDASFSVPGLTGDDEDVFVCHPTALGEKTACSFTPALFFDGSLYGLSSNNIDAIDLP